MKSAALEVRMRAKHQITLPAHLVRQANLHEDDKLSVHFVNGNIVMTPQKNAAPLVDIMSFAGVCKGVWGDTHEEVMASIAELRAGRGR
jgi:bifunctional DNA-binding transcriptional regulator/antitoxin component of YhaV-PrlF toxin-antitoxin module